MYVLALIVGLVIGALAGAAVATRLARSGRERLREELDAISADNRERMRDEMKSISADVLKQTGDSLLQRFGDQRRAEEERAAGEMAKRAEELKGLVGPVNEKLGRVESEIGRLERERKQAQGELANMVRQLHEGVGGLRQETGNLVSALKRPSTRGSWGEIQLRNVIEMAGMVEHCDFLEQSTIQSDDGPLRPDVLVKLPGGKVIVVDSKVPLDAYLAHLEAQTDDERAVQMARHARQTRDHITKLASKGYQRQFDATPDLVVMFVPSDGIYQAALAEDPALIEYGVHQQVLMATPTTLIGLLRAVHYGWRQELIAESAREIAEAARELHRRIARFVDPLAKVGRQLTSAVGAYNEAVGSFDGRVMPQLRRIEEAGAKSERELGSPALVESSPRPLAAQAVGESALGGPHDGERALGGPHDEESALGDPRDGESALGSPHNEDPALGSPHNDDSALGGPHDEESALDSPHNEDPALGSPHNDDSALGGPHDEESALDSPHNEDPALGSPHNDDSALGGPHDEESALDSPHNEDPALGGPHDEESALDSPHNDDSALGAALNGGPARLSA